jgi:predicted GH43/DUF377 family glycosyl hydrolase
MQEKKEKNNLMNDIARRFPQNPLLHPASIQSSKEGLVVACLLNPGVFRFEEKTYLLIRVAERPRQSTISMSFPVSNDKGEIEIMNILLNDADLIATDARVINWKGNDYLTTMSHLRLMVSDDCIHFSEIGSSGALHGMGPLETFGIEDCRVSCIDGLYYLTYTAVSANGVGIALRTTRDWKSFSQHGMILPPHNKDCAIFEKIIHGRFYAFHRPSSVQLGGNYIWLMESPDGVHWGNHRCIVKTRKDKWDSARVGAGAAPIETDRGWLEIYHGADSQHRYCLGAFLLDKNDPGIVLARTDEPIMIPTESYELSGFFGHVVYTNGHILQSDKDTLTVYYGASDEFVCAANFSVHEIIKALVNI